MQRIISVLLVFIMVVFNVDLSRGRVPFAKEVPQTHQKLVNLIDSRLKVTYKGANGTYVTKVSKAKEKDYTAYIELLRQNGYTDYDLNTIGNNKFATLIDSQTTVSCAYFGATGVLRITSEPKGALCVREQDNTYTDRGIKTIMTGMKLCPTVATEGMGFIIRLADGRFVIVDGGMGDPDHVDSNKLMGILSEQNGEVNEKPVIAAWIFTHLHGDHVGVFNCFSIDHHDEVEVQNFYYSFPSEEDVAASDSPYMLDDSIYRYNQFKKCMSEYYPNVPKVKVHTGNKFYAANAEFEVLFAPEDMLPETIATTNMNNSSIIIKMTVGGQTTLWTGDTDTLAIDTVLKNYGDYIKSDILQLAHHGMNGTVKFYSAINPTYAILAFHETGYDAVMSRKQNQWLVESKDLKQLIDTGRGTWTIPLPYAPTDGTYDRLPNANTVNPTYSNN